MKKGGAIRNRSGLSEKQLEEKEKKNICQHELERISEMQYEEIECLRSELHQYKYPTKRTKEKRIQSNSQSRTDISGYSKWNE